ncbi:MAG: hypothetical protein QOK39_2063 [Acidimicrobiaceae bacterium]|jgi:hypothetical protein|nr:hypothetical protein [Acidimicrobiaceae bacterium]
MTNPVQPELLAERAVVLVEGASDQVALETVAARVGRNLGAEGISVVAIGGVTNIGHYLDRFGPRGLDVTLAGLCDAAEVGLFRRGLERAGLGSSLSIEKMEALGFYVCVADLEDELIRALGAGAVEEVIAAEGEMGSYRTFQKQASQLERTREQQLRRFMGTRGGRKIRYARLLVAALPPAKLPRPLKEVLASV